MKQARKRKVRHVKETTYLDESTGEIKKHESVITKISDPEPAYVKLYIEDISRLYALPRGGKDLIYALVKRMDYCGHISLSKAYKDMICEEIGMKDKSIRNALSNLIKKDILRIVGKGLYEMNPDLFAKGSWEEIQRRREKFRLTVDYTADGERKVSGDAVNELN